MGLTRHRSVLVGSIVAPCYPFFVPVALWTSGALSSPHPFWSSDVIVSVFSFGAYSLLYVHGILLAHVVCPWPHALDIKCLADVAPSSPHPFWTVDITIDFFLIRCVLFTLCTRHLVHTCRPSPYLWPCPVHTSPRDQHLMYASLGTPSFQGRKSSQGSAKSASKGSGLTAVLSTSVHALTTKINRLIDMIESNSSPKEQRIWLLMEIADEAQRLKLGGQPTFLL